MPFAVELFFDSQTDMRVRRLWQALADAGINSHMIDVGAQPHISLAVVTELDPEDLRADMEAFARATPCLPFRLNTVGTFPTAEGVVYLAPQVTPQLLDVHRRYHERLARLGVESTHYYRPGRWTPHCTVGVLVPGEKIPAAIAMCQGSDVFGEGELVALGLVEFGTPTGRTKHLYRFPLRADTR